VLLRDYRGRTLGRPGNGRPYEVIFIVSGRQPAMTDSSEKSFFGCRPGRPRRAARTGLFIVAGGASIAMMDYKHPSG